MNSDYIIYDRFSGPMIKKSFLRRMLDRLPANNNDYALEGALGYLFEREHTGEYLPLDKVRNLMNGAIGSGAASQVLDCLFCDEEDLPDMILDDPRSVQAEVARARLGMPKPPPGEGAEYKVTGMRMSPSSLSTLVDGRNRSIPPDGSKMPARRAQALSKRGSLTAHGNLRNL